MEDSEDRLTHSEEALKEQYPTLEGIINSVNAPIFSVDGQYRYTSFNKAHKSVMKAIYGKDIEIGRSLLDCVTVAEDREKAKRNLDRALAGEQFVEETYSGEQTRSRLYFEVSHNPIMTRDGAIIGVTVFAKDITERKHMEEETRISEERYRNLVENSKDSIVMVDMRGNVLFGNRATQELTGYTIEEGVRMNVKDITPLRYWPKSLEMLLKARTGGPIPYFESAIKRKDGRLVPVETGGQAIRQDGKVVGIQIITRDITERKRAEESLRASEEKYRTLVESLHEGIWAIDKEICTTFVNTRMAEMLGYSVDEMLGKPLFSFVDERDVDNARHLFERRREGVRETHDFEFIRKDGSRIYTTLARSPIMDETGNFVGALAGVIDITERRKMEAELEKYTKHLEELVEERTSKLTESERKFRELADLLPQIVFEMDESGNVQFMNRAAFAATGCTEEDFRKGLNAFHMFAPEEHDRAMRGIRRTMTGETIGGREFTILRRDGTTFPVIVYTAPIMREGKTVGVRGIAIDITERKRMEARLVESQRLAAIGETAAMVGHDLRNPLQGIASTVYLAKKTLKSPKAEKRKEAAKLLNTLDEEVYYMDKIVSDLQDYAGPLTADLVETSLSNIIRNTISTTGIPRTVRVSVRVQKGLSKIMADPTLMRRVLTNLVTNALQAMPRGGRLTIRASKKRGVNVITVQDTGEGIARENMEKIFSPFFTTKARGQGLGLPVCKRLVEAQGGTITVKSKIGKGSSFTVEIPARTKPGVT